MSKLSSRGSQSGGRLLFFGGNDRSLWANRGDLIGELLQQGAQVHAALPAVSLSAPAPTHDIPVHRLAMSRTGMNPLADLRSIWCIRSLVAELKPATVLAYNPKPVIHTGLALRSFPDVRFVALITGRGALERRPGLKGLIAYQALSALYASSLSRPDVLLFQNPDDEAFFREHFAAVQRTARVEVIPGSGVNLKRFPRAPLPDGSVRFVLVAKLLIDKGVREFVQAARGVVQQVPKATFRVVGGHDPLLPHALPAEEVNAWKREGLVEFTGRVDDVRPHLAWCSVLCHPSYAEGAPRAVLEALATGRPVITTDAPGCRQTVEDGKSGRVVSVRSTAALARAMVELAQTPRAELEAMGQAAWELASNVYDVQRVNARILEHLGLPRGARA